MRPGDLAKFYLQVYCQKSENTTLKGYSHGYRRLFHVHRIEHRHLRPGRQEIAPGRCRPSCRAQLSQRLRAPRQADGVRRLDIAGSLREIRQDINADSRIAQYQTELT